jgi:hypothetical protein
VFGDSLGYASVGVSADSVQRIFVEQLFVGTDLGQACIQSVNEIKGTWAERTYHRYLLEKGIPVVTSRWNFLPLGKLILMSGACLVEQLFVVFGSSPRWSLSSACFVKELFVGTDLGQACIEVNW